MPQIKGPGTLQPSQPLKARIADIRRAVELGAITGTNTTLHLDSECASVVLAMFQCMEYVVAEDWRLADGGYAEAATTHARAAKPGIQPRESHPTK